MHRTRYGINDALASIHIDDALASAKINDALASLISYLVFLG
jgi:hypothetical protein